MKNRTLGVMRSIRRGWSESERDQRRKLAGEKQLQLRQLVALAELAGPKRPQTRRTAEMAR